MWDTFIAEMSKDAGLPLAVIVPRMLGAALFCGLIGFERETSHRPAGLRTHMLIGLASCVYCLLTLVMLSRTADMSDSVRMDPLRVINAVTSGVAFLAAGLIVFAQGKVHGLTTGASMWLAAAVGVACGLGEWAIAGLTTGLALIVIAVLRQFEKAAGTNQDTIE